MSGYLLNVPDGVNTTPEGIGNIITNSPRDLSISIAKAPLKPILLDESSTRLFMSTESMLGFEGAVGVSGVSVEPCPDWP